MIHDLLTVLWKEWRELLRQRGNWRGFLLGLLVPVLVFGVMLPLQAGERWVQSPVSLMAWFYLPVAMVVTMMADSFAGERERHTLETLLASRLPDGAILYGKVLAAVSYALGLALAVVMVALGVVNLFHSEGELLLYSAPLFWGGVVGGLLISLLGAAVGVLVSLRASTVRQATQTLSYATLALFFIPFILFEMLPAWLVDDLIHLARPLLRQGPAVLLVFAGALVLLDLILLAVARARFRRSRLMVG